jgi:hypothetical protein
MASSRRLQNSVPIKIIISHTRGIDLVGVVGIRGWWRMRVEERRPIMVYIIPITK